MALVPATAGDHSVRVASVPLCGTDILLGAVSQIERPIPSPFGYRPISGRLFPALVSVLAGF